MLKILVSYALGPWGLKVLYLYLEKAAIINSIVFIYGIFLVVSHYNFSKILDLIIIQFDIQARRKNNKKPIKIDLDKAIMDGKIFPFVSGQFSLVARKVGKDNVLRYLKKDKKWIKLVDGKKIELV